MRLVLVAEMRLVLVAEIRVACMHGNEIDMIN